MISAEGSVLARQLEEDSVRIEARFARESGPQKPLRPERPGPRFARRAGIAAGLAAALSDRYRYLVVHDLVFASL
jgi:hypothetical protein